MERAVGRVGSHAAGRLARVARVCLRGLRQIEPSKEAHDSEVL